METIELQYILDHSPMLSTLNAVVCAKDQLPHRRPSSVRGYIVNTDNSDQPGEHWVAIYFNKDNTAYYFDSYGIPPSQREIQSFLERHGRYTWNFMRLQEDFTSVCGLYCVYALHFLVRGCDLNKLLRSKFRTEDQYNFDLNDYSVGMWFQSNYGELYKQSRMIRGEHVCNQTCHAVHPLPSSDTRFYFDIVAGCLDRSRYERFR